MKTIEWVTYETLDLSKAAVVEKKLLYKYPNVKDLLYTTPLNPDTYIYLNKIAKTTFTKDAKKFETNRHTATFSIHYPEHIQFSRALEAIFCFIENSIQTKCKYPITMHDNVMYIYADLIESKEGMIYTSAYDSEKSLKVTDIQGRHLVRPAFSFSVTSTFRIRMSLVQMFVHSSIDLFPLHNRE